MNLRRHRGGLILAVMVMIGGVGQAGGIDGVAKRMDALFSDPDYADAVWSCLVVSLRDGEVLYERNANLPMVPASNQKLFVAAAALAELGPDYRGRTEFRGGPVVGGRLDGDLHVCGYGSFDFTARFPPDRPVGERRVALDRELDDFAARLRAAGIHEISGELVAHSDGWTDMERNTHYPPAHALVFHDNTLDIEVAAGRVLTCPSPVHEFRLDLRRFKGTQERCGGQDADSDVIRVNPTRASRDYWRLQSSDPLLYYIQNLRTALRVRGVAVMGEGRRAAADEAAGALLIETKGLSLSELVGAMLTYSDNLRAESVFLQLGYAKTGRADYGVAGEVCARVLRERGWAGDAFRAADGSGLSQENRACASDVVRLLRGLRSSPYAGVFLESLAIAGETGTLAKRLQVPEVKGRVRGKTGTLSGVSALSGYAKTRGGGELCFSFLCNRSPGGGRCWDTFEAACGLLCTQP